MVTPPSFADEHGRRYALYPLSPLMPDFPSQSSSTISPPSAARHAFERRVDEVRPSKTDINYVIMDYLINEGYPSAAQKFAKEANIQQSAPGGAIQARVDIRNAIHAGEIQQAIEKINELDKQILDTNPELHFYLLRLQLVELIRDVVNLPGPPSPDSFVPALTFAQEQLAPRAPTSSVFLQDLERTMALLIFPAEKMTPQLKELLDPALRQKVARTVNEAILESQGERREARIRSMVRLRAWAEQEGRNAKLDLPEKIHAGLGVDESAPEQDGHDSDEVMIT